jgi:hypothetical protein
MQVSRLYILKLYPAEGSTGVGAGAGAIAEITGGAQGLYSKYVLTRKLGNAGTLIGVEVDFKKNEVTSTTVEHGSEPNADDGAEKVGVYVFGHGHFSTCGGLEASGLASLIGSRINLKRVDKLCLVSCGLADENLGVPYIASLCIELAKFNLFPLVAGWDDFITIAYAGMNQFYPHDSKKKIDITNDMVGKKILRGKQGWLNSKNVLANHQSTATKRDQLITQKHVWQFKGGVAVKVAAGWSDKVAP